MKNNKFYIISVAIMTAVILNGAVAYAAEEATATENKNSSGLFGFISKSISEKFSKLAPSKDMITTTAAQPQVSEPVAPIAPIAEAPTTTAPVAPTVAVKPVVVPTPIHKPEFKEAEATSTTEDAKPVVAKKIISTAPVIIDGDVDEATPLPVYAEGAMLSLGKNETYKIHEEDTLLDISRYFNLGYIEIVSANPDIDAWVPGLGREVNLPFFKLLPRTDEQEGIIVNLAQMRMYFFKEKGQPPVTFPIGIGREGLQTPVGKTTIVRKTANPTWSPTDRMREEKPWLPKVVPAGPSNPLGLHALYLGWPTFLMHGSNKPWAIGRRVSSGCMRMYPTNIKELYETVPVGTKVTVVNQPILVAEIDGKLYLEVHPSLSQSNDIEMKGTFTPKGLDDGIKKVITDAAGDAAPKIKWDIVKQVMLERRGYPIQIN